MDRQQAIRYFNGLARALGPEQELEAITALQRGLAAPRQPAK